MRPPKKPRPVTHQRPGPVREEPQAPRKDPASQKSKTPRAKTTRSANAGRPRREAEAADQPIETHPGTPARSLPTRLRRKRTESAAPEIPLHEHRKKSSDPYPLSSKIETKRKARRKKLLLRSLALLTGIAIVAGVVWALFFSSLFTVDSESIEVAIDDPVGIVDETEVRQIAETAVGKPVLRMPGGEIESALEDLPEVLDATVTTSFPNGMAVTIDAREPIACVGTSDSCVGISDDATQIALTQEQRDSLPKITMNVDSDRAQAQLTGLIDAVSTLPEDVRARVQTASVSDSGLIEFQLDEGLVKWGPSEQNEKKARIIAVLLEQSAGTYDVTSPDAPITY